jgi:hypothetical protein
VQPGQLITDPERPDEPICNTPLPFTRLERTEEYFDAGQTFVATTETKGWAGLSLGILNYLKLAWSGEKGSSYRHRFDVEMLETKLMEPSQDYLQMSMQQRPVLEHLQKNESIFMIVDVRIAHGAFTQHEEYRGKLGGIDVNVPLSSVSLGPDVGLRGGGKSIKTSATLSAVSHEFIFAYRLRECFYTGPGSHVNIVAYTKGANIHGLGEKEGKHSLQSRVMVATSSVTPPEEEVKAPGSPRDFVIQGLNEDYTVLEGGNSKFRDDCILVGLNPIDE